MGSICKRSILWYFFAYRKKRNEPCNYGRLWLWIETACRYCRESYRKRNKKFCFHRGRCTTKTFSLAGLIGSYHIIYNDRLRCRVQRQGNLSGYNDCNVLSMHALTGAYSDEGMAWVDQLCAVLDRNLRYIRDFLQSRYPVVTMMLPQGTYMLFVNCGAWCRSHGITPDDLRRRGVEHGVIWQSGAGFGDGDCIRINAALPHSLVREAMDRLEKYVFVG